MCRPKTADIWTRQGGAACQLRSRQLCYCNATAHLRHWDADYCRKNSTSHVCNAARQHGGGASRYRSTPKSATSLQCCGTTTMPIHCRSTRAQLFSCRTSARCPVRGGATAAHPYPFDCCAASTGPVRDCTSLTQLCDRRATATR
jgi:hypothetical protein